MTGFVIALVFAGAALGFAGGGMWWAVCTIAGWPTPTEPQMLAAVVMGVVVLPVFGGGAFLLAAFIFDARDARRR